MKKLATVLALMLSAFAALAQSDAKVVFWADSEDGLPVRVYIDKEYVGDITEAYDDIPVFGALGALSVYTTPGRHNVAAVNCYGEVYTGTNTFRASEEKMRDVMFRSYLFDDQKDYVRMRDFDFIFIGWDPIIRPPYHPHPRRPADDYDWDEDVDNAAKTAVGVAAVAGAAVMGTAAIKNWHKSDNRFPYFSFGFRNEHLHGIGIRRRTMAFERRLGGKGGMTIGAEFGYQYPNSHRNRMYLDPTWAVKIGFDYGGFDFALRAKPLPILGFEAFYLADCRYNLWLGRHFGINFGLGYGISTYEPTGEYVDIADFRFEKSGSFGLSWKF